MASLDVFAYQFDSEAQSLAAYQAVMRLIAGGSAYRLRTPDGSKPPMLVVFALGEAARGCRAACQSAGGTITSIEPELLASLTERSLRAAQHSITGKRHHEPGTPPGERLPDDPGDYTPREE